MRVHVNINAHISGITRPPRLVTVATLKGMQAICIWFRVITPADLPFIIFIIIF